MTVKYIYQADNSSWCTLCFDTKIFSRLVTDWLVENMSPRRDPTSLDISVFIPKNKN